MTVPVSVQQRIRVLDAHGMSWRSIAKEVGVARDTVAKYAGREDCSPGPERSVSRPSKLDPFRATVDGWLQADRFMPRKQRHTAKRVYDRLVSEKGYEGSYSPVQRYVVLLQCLFDRFGSVFPQCGLMVFPGVVIVSR